MASKGTHTLNPGYRSGDNWNTCDRCGFEFRVSVMKKEWNGLDVCEDCFETRHPQDFLRAKEEKIVPDDPGTQDSCDTVADASAAAAMAANRAANPQEYTVPDGNFTIIEAPE